MSGWPVRAAFLRDKCRNFVMVGLALAAGVAAGAGSANDTEVQLAAGGLHFVPNAEVRMVSEDLYLSMDEIRVEYVFENTSDTKQRLLVAFSMPDIAGDDLDPVA